MVGVAQADNYLMRAGCVGLPYPFVSGAIAGEVQDIGSAALTSGCKVEAFWIGGNSKINDPKDYGVSNPLSDDYTLLYKSGSTGRVGDDTDTWSSFAGTVGQFYHEWVEVGHPSINSGSPLFIRVWDSAAPGPTSKFGESVFIYAASTRTGDPPPSAPNNYTLGIFKAMLPQTAPALAPVGSSLVPVGAARPGESPLLRVAFNRVVGARWYVIQVSQPKADPAGTFDFSGPYRSATHENPNHKADLDTSAFGAIPNIALAATDDLKYFKIRVIPYNDYGPGPYEEIGPVQIPATPDTNKPVPVTDLQAAYDSTRGVITLTWSAPYDLDSHNVETPCAAYEIKVSPNGFVYPPAQDPFVTGSYFGNTNPGAIDTYATASEISAYPGITSITPALPLTPLAYGTAQRLEISGSLSGGYFFALRAQDRSGSWSYISNVAGINTVVGTDEIVSYRLNKVINGMGVNAVSFPWIPFSSGTIVEVDTLQELAQVVNQAAVVAGSNARVTALGYWTGNPAGIREITYDAGRNPTGWTYTTGVSGTTPLDRNRSYQIWIADPNAPADAASFDLVARGRR